VAQAQSRELRQALELPCERDALLEGPLEPLLADRDVEAGLARAAAREPKVCQ